MGRRRRPGRESEPRVLFGVGTNTLRRTRGGRRMLLENLWPKLRLIVSVDSRMSTTGAWWDVVLPAAPQFERSNLQYPLTNTFHLGFSDKCAARQGESKSEWKISACCPRRWPSAPWSGALPSSATAVE